MRIAYFISLSILFFTSCYAETDTVSKTYNIELTVALLPDTQEAQVSWSIKNARWLTLLDFNLNKLELTSLKANGTLSDKGKRLHWQPPKKDAHFSYKVSLINKRNADAYDAWIEADWALFRGEDIFPPVRIKKIKGGISTSHLNFKLPADWTDVNTAWIRNGDGFSMGPSADIALPKGWMIAGKLGTRHEKLNGMQVTVSAPRGHNFRQMETIAFVTAIWPHFKSVFKPKGEKALIVGAGEPMWRGGLSGPESMFVHADRPLISENGTSTLLHELVHSLSDIKGAPGYDWITEGLAEYYSIDILYRAGFFTQARRETVIDGQREWASSSAKDAYFSLVGGRSTAEDTARAVFVFHLLERELHDAGHTLDALLNSVENNEAMTLEMLRTAFQRLTDRPSHVLKRIRSS